MRTSRYLTHDEIIGIYLASGMGKNIAADYGTSMATVSEIKSGKRYASITRHSLAVLNATLISMAFTGAA